MAIVTSVGANTTAVHSTPPEAVAALVRALSDPPDLIARFGGVLWEPAVGSGALLDALLAQLPAPPVRIIATDVEPRERATYGPADFTQLRPPAGAPTSARPRVIITNPPFRLATKFMSVGLSWLEGVPDSVLALFVPLGALAGQARAEQIYADRPPTMIVALANRMTIYPDGVEPSSKSKGSIEYCWLVWLNDASGAPMAPAEAAARGIRPFQSLMAAIPEG